MTSTITPVRITPKFLEVLKEERRTLAELAKELGRESNADYSSASGYNARTPTDNYTTQMFARALGEVTSMDRGVGLVRARYGTWEHPLFGEDGRPVMSVEKKPKPMKAQGKTFRFKDPTARLSGAVMLNLEFGVQNLVGENDVLSPRPVYSATISILTDGTLVGAPRKPRSEDDKRFYDSLKNYF